MQVSAEQLKQIPRWAFSFIPDGDALAKKADALREAEGQREQALAALRDLEQREAKLQSLIEARDRAKHKADEAKRKANEAQIAYARARAAVATETDAIQRARGRARAVFRALADPRIDAYLASLEAEVQRVGPPVVRIVRTPRRWLSSSGRVRVVLSNETAWRAWFDGVEDARRAAEALKDDPHADVPAALAAIERRRPPASTLEKLENLGTITPDLTEEDIEARGNFLRALACAAGEPTPIGRAHSGWFLPGEPGDVGLFDDEE